MNPELAAISMLKEKLRGNSINEIMGQFKQGGAEDQEPTIANELSDVSPIVEEEPLPPEILEFIAGLM